MNNFLKQLLELGIKLSLDATDNIKVAGKKENLTPELLGELKQKKQEIVAWLKQDATQDSARIERVENREQLCLTSFSQQRLWLIDQLQAGSAQYNMPMAWQVQGELDLGLIKQVFESILTRHEVLRTVYVDVDGEAMQRIRPMSEITFDIQVEDVRALSTAEQEEAVRARVTADIEQAFDLAEDVMLRVGYIHTSDSSGVLLFNMHHIASDGWSMEVLNKEFFTLYEAYSQNQANPLPEL
ncbi:condensation domain-containing protein, partial [Pseudoalteromonas sp. JW3]